VRGTTRIRFSLPAAGEFALEVFDVRGARVRRVASGWRAAGEHAERWDGHDDAGQALAPGLYWTALTVGERRLTRSVVISR
jgi:flagellar hook assembly protein FlgD